MNFKPCPFSQIETAVGAYYTSNQITVDSYWEDHVIQSQCYEILDNDQQVGFFAIFEENLITLFHVFESHAKYGQEIFDQVKKYEQVTSAYVPTGDEFFLSHAVDNFTKLEKQAYFTTYTDEGLAPNKIKHLNLVPIVTKEDTQLFQLTKDFFEEDSAQRILDKVPHFKVYKVEENGQLIGFGVVEYGRVVKSMASIGMYVMADKRQQGYAANILHALRVLVEEQGFTPRSGCWYYNHNSKKSMASAGAYAKTRLLKFFF